MKKKLVVLTVLATLICSSMTVSAQAPNANKPEFLMKFSVEVADLYGTVNQQYNEVDELVVGNYYADMYPDLKLAYGYNLGQLQNHFSAYGLAEGRLCNPVLDVQSYRESYPDLQLAFGNNIDLYVQHYFQYGILEGRDNGTDFNPEIYISLYPDLQAAFGKDNYVAATMHYLEYGYEEGRMYNWTEPEIVYEEPDNDNDDDNNTEEKFTGDKRVEHEGGSYIIATYVNGILVFDKFYDEDGTLVNETTYTYDTNDNMVSSQTKDASGNLLSEQTYYESGASKTIIQYEADGKKSFYEEYDEQGRVTLYVDYQEDGITEEYKEINTYDENGNLKSDKITWADGSTAEMTYENGVRTYQVDIYADGMKCETEYYEDGQTLKKETTTNTDGTKIISEYYETGMSKTCTWYDASGNIIRQQLYDEDENLIYDSDDA